MKKNSIFTLLIILISSFVTQCKKQNDDIGAGLISKNHKTDAVFIDTITVSSSTHKIDKIKTDNVVYTLVGSYIDPIFGHTKASFATQMLMSNETSDNDSLILSGVVADSLVIYLKYPVQGTQVYGNADKMCKVNISKINAFLDETDTYYSNHDVSKLNAEFEHSISFNPKQIIEDAKNLAEETWQNKIDSALKNKEDTSKIAKIQPNPFVAVKMPDKFKNEIYETLIHCIKDKETFVEQFNGLYFSSDDESKNTSVSIFNYISKDTRVALYYHKKSKPKEAVAYPLSLNSSTTHFNIFSHEFSEGNILKNFDNSKNKLDTVVYLQGIAGVNTKIQFPYINEMLKQGKWAVTMAQIILTVPQNSELLEKKYPAPEELMLYRVNENNEVFELHEFLKGKKYYGELYKENQYIFDVTLFMQKMLRGEYKNNELLVNLRNEAINPARVVLGANTGTNKVKLKLVASKL